MINVNKPIRIKNKDYLSVSLLSYNNQLNNIACDVYDSTSGVLQTNVFFKLDTGEPYFTHLNLQLENIPEQNIEDKIKENVDLKLNGIFQSTLFSHRELPKIEFGLLLIKNIKKAGLIKYD